MSEASTLITKLLQLPDTQLITSIKSPPVYTVVTSLIVHSPEDSLRQSLHQLIYRLVRLQALDLPLLIVYTTHYYPLNQSLVENTINDAFNLDPNLATSTRQLLQQSIDSLHNLQHDPAALNHVLTLYLATSTSTSFQDFNNPPSMQLLNQIYSQLSNTASPESDHLKLLLLTTTSQILLSPTSTLEELSFQIEPLLAHSSSLGRDLERYLHISEDLLESRVQGQVGEVARKVKDSIGKLKKNSTTSDSQDDGDEWIERIRRKKELGGNAEVVVEDGITADSNASKGGEDPNRQAEIASVSSFSSLSHIVISPE